LEDGHKKIMKLSSRRKLRKC